MPLITREGPSAVWSEHKERDEKNQWELTFRGLMGTAEIRRQLSTPDNAGFARAVRLSEREPVLGLLEEGWGEMDAFLKGPVILSRTEKPVMPSDDPEFFERVQNALLKASDTEGRLIATAKVGQMDNAMKAFLRERGYTSNQSLLSLAKEGAFTGLRHRLNKAKNVFELVDGQPIEVFHLNGIAAHFDAKYQNKDVLRLVPPLTATVQRLFDYTQRVVAA